MANAGSIVVNLIARTEAFTKGISRSRRNLAALNKATVRTMQTIKLFGAIAATAAISGLTVLTKKSMQSIDVIAKLSDRIGVSTEFLSAFGHAATIAGTSQQDFNKSIEMFVRRLGEVRLGTGEAKDGLKALGLTSEELINMGTEEAFIRVADGIKGLSSQADKAAVAYKFFGRSGSKMLNLLESNLSGVGAEADRLNITYSRGMAASVEQANDAIARMKKALGGVGNTLAIAVAPVVENIADRLADMVSGANSLEAMQKRIQSVAIAITYISDEWLVVKGAIRGIIGTVQKLHALSTVLPAEIAKGFAKLAEMTGMDELAEKIRSVSDGIDEVGQAIMEAGRENIKLAKQDFLGVGKSREELKKFFADLDAEDNTPKMPKVPQIATEEEAKKKTFDFKPTGRGIDTSLVSVSGLAMGARTVTLNDVDRTLQEIERNTRKAANQEMLN